MNKSKRTMVTLTEKKSQMATLTFLLSKWPVKGKSIHAVKTVFGARKRAM